MGKAAESIYLQYGGEKIGKLETLLILQKYSVGQKKVELYFSLLCDEKKSQIVQNL